VLYHLRYKKSLNGLYLLVQVVKNIDLVSHGKVSALIKVYCDKSTLWYDFIKMPQKWACLFLKDRVAEF